MFLPVLLALAAVFAALCIYAYAIEPAWLRIRKRVLFLESWDPSLDGLTILHLSDLHIGRSNKRLIRFLEKASRIKADVIVITGDFVDTVDDVEDIPDVLAPLKDNKLVLGVPGNHDRFYHTGHRPGRTGDPFDPPDVVDRALEAAGVTMLVDTTLSVPVKDATVIFAGVDLSHGRIGRLDAILEGIRDSSSTLILAHYPEILWAASRRGIPLVLSGHTHGGQVRIGPWLTPTTGTVVPMRPPSGVLTRHRTVMHISPGLGTTYLPFRFFARPEATLLELRSA